MQICTASCCLIIYFLERAYVWLTVDCNSQITIGGKKQSGGFDVPIVKRLLLLRRHLHPGVVDDVVEHLVDVDAQGCVQSGAELLQDRLGLDGVAGVGAEVVQEAVNDVALLQGVQNVVAALVPLDHDEEVDVRQGLDQRPVVAVAGDQDDGVHAVGVDLFAGAGGQRHIHLGFPLVEAQDRHMLDGEITGFGQDAPARCRVFAVKEQDLGYLRL